MNKFKLLCLVAVLMLLVAVFAACGTAETTTETTTAAPGTTTPEVTTTSVPATTVAPTFSSVKIGENDLKDYTIVYAKSPYHQLANYKNYKDLYPVYDFDKETADRLSDLIFELSGIRLAVSMDTKTTAGTKEILIGKTNRKEITNGLGELKTDDFVIKSVGTSLVICGGEHGTTWHALDYLEKLLNGALEEGKRDYTFASDYSYKGEYHLTRIGCIGDSITQGVGSSAADRFAYPAQLARFLWKDAIVLNFGNSGKTMRNDLNDAFVKTQTYTDALNAAADVDIFTVMLGTNDSNRDRNWNDNSTKQYMDSCRLLFENLSARNSDITFVIANCPAYFGADGFGSAKVRSLQKQLVTDMNEAGFKTEFFDMYTPTRQMREYFPDTLHPNDMGHMKMAEVFSKALAEIISPTEDKAN